MRLIIFFLFSFVSFDALSQAVAYSQANAHSHNDYEQKNPFHEAYNEQFGSIEEDVHLVASEKELFIKIEHDRCVAIPFEITMFSKQLNRPLLGAVRIKK